MHELGARLVPICSHCNRAGIPALPMTQTTLGIMVSHVTDEGEPCLEGLSPEAHAVVYADYPREELTDDDSPWWDLPGLAPIAPKIAAPRPNQAEVRSGDAIAALDLSGEGPVATARRRAVGASVVAPGGAVATLNLGGPVHPAQLPPAGDYDQTLTSRAAPFDYLKPDGSPRTEVDQPNLPVATAAPADPGSHNPRSAGAVSPAKKRKPRSKKS